MSSSDGFFVQTLPAESELKNVMAYDPNIDPALLHRDLIGICIFNLQNLEATVDVKERSILLLRKQLCKREDADFALDEILSTEVCWKIMQLYTLHYRNNDEEIPPFSMVKEILFFFYTLCGGPEKSTDHVIKVGGLDLFGAFLQHESAEMRSLAVKGFASICCIDSKCRDMTKPWFSTICQQIVDERDKEVLRQLCYFFRQFASVQKYLDTSSYFAVLPRLQELLCNSEPRKKPSNDHPTYEGEHIIDVLIQATSTINNGQRIDEGSALIAVNSLTNLELLKKYYQDQLVIKSVGNVADQQTGYAVVAEAIINGGEDFTWAYDTLADGDCEVLSLDLLLNDNCVLIYRPLPARQENLLQQHPDADEAIARESMWALSYIGDGDTRMPVIAKSDVINCCAAYLASNSIGVETKLPALRMVRNFTCGDEKIADLVFRTGCMAEVPNLLQNTSAEVVRETLGWLGNVAASSTPSRLLQSGYLPLCTGCLNREFSVMKEALWVFKNLSDVANKDQLSYLIQDCQFLGPFLRILDCGDYRVVLPVLDSITFMIDLGENIMSDDALEDNPITNILNQHGLTQKLQGLCAHPNAKVGQEAHYVLDSMTRGVDDENAGDGDQDHW